MAPLNYDQAMENWFKSSTSEEIKEKLQQCKNEILKLLRSSEAEGYHGPGSLPQLEKKLRKSLEVIKLLYEVNGRSKEKKLSYLDFYLPELSDGSTEVDVRVDFLQWNNTEKKKEHLFFCDHPWLLDIEAKRSLVETSVHSPFQRGLEDWIFDRDSHLYLSVTREDIVRDTFTIISRLPKTDVKKPLKIIFDGEEGIDDGGLQKEFFLYLLRRILKPEFGMFRMDEQSQRLWFAPKSYEDERMFLFLGIVCGMAFYNSTLVELHFPLALFKKLLNEDPTFEDFAELHPTEARSFQQILEGDSCFVEDLCLTFEYGFEFMGQQHLHPLKKDGSNIPVTYDNRQEYVDLYVDYVLNKQISSYFHLFRSGFMQVCDEKLLRLFSPQELKDFVVGKEIYSWKELKQACNCDKNEVVIQYFWDVFFEDLSEEERKQLLMFLTGCDRVPIQGMKFIETSIQLLRNKGDESCPTAMTCYSKLLLPQYSSRKILFEQLQKAIYYTDGFDLE